MGEIKRRNRNLHFHKDGPPDRLQEMMFFEQLIRKEVRKALQTPKPKTRQTKTS